MKVEFKFHLPYIWPKWQPSGSAHIIDHLILELLLNMHVLVYAKGTIRGHCSAEYAECVDGHIIQLPKRFKGGITTI